MQAQRTITDRNLHTIVYDPLCEGIELQKSDEEILRRLRWSRILYRLLMLLLCLFFIKFGFAIISFLVNRTKAEVDDDVENLVIPSAMELVGAVLCFVLIWITIHKLSQVKLPEDILADFFQGFSKGAVMLSYCWGGGTALPRKVASVFPCAWVDIANLNPGVPVKPTCSQAARDAKFRLVFPSAPYLRPPNCGVEWAEV